jgi:predicted ABC-type ATPase
MDAKRESALKPTCWIIAGPNGAGKTTFALRFLKTLGSCKRFINADLIAAGLSPLAPERELAHASRLFLKEIEHAISAREDFAFETTLSGRSYLKLIDRVHLLGWRAKLIYLALPDVATSRMRVAERVSHGGHDVPESDLQRRFPRSLRNFLEVFAERVDETVCLWNGDNGVQLVFRQEGTARKIVNPALFAHLLKEASDATRSR